MPFPRQVSPCAVRLLPAAESLLWKSPPLWPAAALLGVSSSATTPVLLGEYGVGDEAAGEPEVPTSTKAGAGHTSPDLEPIPPGGPAICWPLRGHQPGPCPKVQSAGSLAGSCEGLVAGGAAPQVPGAEGPADHPPEAQVSVAREGTWCSSSCWGGSTGSLDWFLTALSPMWPAEVIAWPPEKPFPRSREEGLLPWSSQAVSASHPLHSLVCPACSVLPLPRTAPSFGWKISSFLPAAVVVAGRGPSGSIQSLQGRRMGQVCAKKASPANFLTAEAPERPPLKAGLPRACLQGHSHSAAHLG